MKFRKTILKMEEYKPPLEGRGEKKWIRLDFNEMLSPLPKIILSDIKRFIDSGKISLYPEYGNLENEIASYNQISKSEVLITNGSDQAIDIICRLFLNEGDKVIIPKPNFAMHFQSSLISGAKVLSPNYLQDGSFPLKEVFHLFKRKPKLLIFANPNNPLGTWINEKDLLFLLKKAKKEAVAVVHDEAYFEFSKISLKDYLKKFENLFITRSFSKTFGLAGLRIGYILSRRENIFQLRKIRGPYDINILAKVATLSALKNKSYMEKYVKEVMEIAKPILEKFLKKKGIKFFPSRANFLFLKLKDPKLIEKKLKDFKILTRVKEGINKKKGLRITVGNLKLTKKLISALTKIGRLLN